MARDGGALVLLRQLRDRGLDEDGSRVAALLVAELDREALVRAELARRRSA